MISYKPKKTYFIRAIQFTPENLQEIIPLLGCCLEKTNVEGEFLIKRSAYYDAGDIPFEFGDYIVLDPMTEEWSAIDKETFEERFEVDDISSHIEKTKELIAITFNELLDTFFHEDRKTDAFLSSQMLINFLKADPKLKNGLVKILKRKLEDETK